MIDTGRVYVPSIAALVLVLAGAAAGRAEASQGQQPREIKMIARKFVFVPKQVTVQKGERIRLLLTSEDVDHGIALKAFDIDQVVKANETKAIEFTADKEGRFEFLCSVFCGDGHPDMVGELIVTAARNTQSAPSNISVRFDDAEPGVVLIEARGERLRIDTNTRSVTTVAADDPTPEVIAVPEPLPEAGKPLNALAQGEKQNPREPYDYLVVNVPTPKRVPHRSLNLHFTHRFQQPFWPLDESANDLFGLDSTAVAAFGFSYGFTDRLYGKIYRSPLCRTGLCRTIEMGVGYHWLDEAGRSPVALSTYASVEGDDNFRHDYTWNIQAMVGRSITKYVNAFFSPAVHINSNGNGRFNPRPELTPFPEEVSKLRLGQHTGSFGFGFNGRVRPSFSLVFDYTPRVGFKMGRITPILDQTTGDLIRLKNESEAGLGFGFEKRLGRHVFTLTFSNTQTTTTARYNSSNLVLAPSKVIIGFNIFRRLL
jgi:cytochrome c oxidase subunit 2